MRERRTASTTVHTRKMVATSARMRMANRHCFTGMLPRPLVELGATELCGERP